MSKQQRSVSLSFSVGGLSEGSSEDDHSVALYSEIGDEGFVVLALVYLVELAAFARTAAGEAEGQGAFGPLLRKEPQTVMVDFIRALSCGDRVTWNYSLYPSTMYAPETELGHYVIQLHGSFLEHYTDTPWPARHDQAKWLAEFRDNNDGYLEPDQFRVTEYIRRTPVPTEEDAADDE